MRVVLLTNDSKQSKLLELLMVNEGINLTKVIKITSKKKITLLKQIKNRIGKVIWKITTSLKQDRRTNAALKFEGRCKQEAQAILNKFISDKMKSLPNHKTSCLEVDAINSEIVIAELKKESPDICVVWGTPIIKAELLNMANVFINAHTSILPYYKGTRSEFWQCYNQDLDSVGVTFHKIDKGVDTGDIISQVKQSNASFVEPFHLRSQNTILVLKYYPKIIKSMINNTATTSSQNEQVKGKTYRYIDITLDKRVKLYGNLLNGKVKTS